MTKSSIIGLSIPEMGEATGASGLHGRIALMWVVGAQAGG